MKPHPGSLSTSRARNSARSPDRDRLIGARDVGERRLRDGVDALDQVGALAERRQATPRPARSPLGRQAGEVAAGRILYRSSSLKPRWARNATPSGRSSEVVMWR